MSQNQQLEDLITCYDAQASHFHNTRGFHKRPELTFIKEILERQLILTGGVGSAKQLQLLDLGCGTGRVTQRLDIQGYDTISYQGIDISPGMITQARKEYPHKEFAVGDMLGSLQSMQQQSVDIILCLASYHHLQTRQERLHTLHNLYRVLEYGGIAILVNRSFSHRFLEKYRSSVLQALLKSIGTLGASKRNDILIPWKDPNFDTNQEIHHRYYHIFTLQELTKLIQTTDFELIDSCYVAQDGKKNYHRSDSRNSFVVIRK